MKLIDDFFFLISQFLKIEASDAITSETAVEFEDNT